VRLEDVEVTEAAMCEDPLEVTIVDKVVPVNVLMEEAVPEKIVLDGIVALLDETKPDVEVVALVETIEVVGLDLISVTLGTPEEDVEALVEAISVGTLKVTAEEVLEVLEEVLEEALETTLEEVLEVLEVLDVLDVEGIGCGSSMNTVAVLPGWAD
jgi:hypothetical protein